MVSYQPGYEYALRAVNRVEQLELAMLRPALWSICSTWCMPAPGAVLCHNLAAADWWCPAPGGRSKIPA